MLEDWVKIRKRHKVASQSSLVVKNQDTTLPVFLDDISNNYVVALLSNFLTMITIYHMLAAANLDWLIPSETNPVSARLISTRTRA